MDCLTPVMVAVTRLCHDLAGPVSALESGTNLLEEDCADGAPLDDEICALLKDTASLGALRLQLARFTLGLAGTGSTLTDTPTRLLGSCLTPVRKELVWSPADVRTLDPAELRLLILGVLASADLWPASRGFVLSCSGPGHFAVTPCAPPPDCGPFRADLLDGLADAPHTGNVFLWFALHLARQQNARLVCPESCNDSLHLGLASLHTAHRPDDAPPACRNAIPSGLRLPRE